MRTPGRPLLIRQHGSNVLVGDENRATHARVMSPEQYRAAVARYEALEQAAADRARFKQILQDCERAIKDEKERRRREAARAKAAEHQRKIDAIAAAKKAKADAFYRATLRWFQTAFRSWKPTVGQASVQQAPPVVPKLEEIATIADAERAARAALDHHAALNRQLAVMHVDLDAPQITRGPIMDRKAALKF